MIGMDQLKADEREKEKLKRLEVSSAPSKGSRCQQEHNVLNAASLLASFLFSLRSSPLIASFSSRSLPFVLLFTPLFISVLTSLIGADAGNV